MEDIVMIFLVLVELVSVVTGVGIGYYFGRKDKILGVLVDERGP